MVEGFRHLARPSVRHSVDCIGCPTLPPLSQLRTRRTQDFDCKHLQSAASVSAVVKTNCGPADVRDQRGLHSA